MDLLPQVDAWMKVAAFALATVGTFLYTAQGPLKEWLAYKARIKEAEATKVDTARAISQTPFEFAVGVSTICEHLDDIAAAIREGNTAAGARDRDRLARAVEDLQERLEEDRSRHHSRR